MTAPRGGPGRDGVTTEVRAAGGLVLDGSSVLLVHRPRYDDWTLPKGKLEADESWEDAAVREVEEETGLRCRILGPEPFVSRYQDRRGRSKEVRYYVMERTDGRDFVPNDEVDRLRWCSLDDAVAWLSYETDRGVLRHLAGPS
jgi:8-oxo-dGTP diphosphatase